MDLHKVPETRTTFLVYWPSWWTVQSRTNDHLNAFLLTVLGFGLQPRIRRGTALPSFCSFLWEVIGVHRFRSQLAGYRHVYSYGR